MDQFAGEVVPHAVEPGIHTAPSHVLPTPREESVTQPWASLCTESRGETLWVRYHVIQGPQLLLPCVPPNCCPFYSLVEIQQRTVFLPMHDGGTVFQHLL